MRCTSPKKVGFYSDGKTICWSQAKRSKEYPAFQLPCGKCIECRLQYAREWAIRSLHEAMTHKENIFLTLTYTDEHLDSPWLQYDHFQDFMKKLRHETDNTISYIVAGEYGDQTKRPHWHAIIFNYAPKDPKPRYRTKRGDQVYTSKTIDDLWGKGFCEYGSVTLESAGYVARYATKKLLHGHDDEHDYQPIFKTSSRRAIGRSWLEKYWRDAFNYGRIITPDGASLGIPRYYQKWLKQQCPREWQRYVTETLPKQTAFALERQRREEVERYKSIFNKKNGWEVKTRNQVRNIIAEQRFKILMQNLKL